MRCPADLGSGFLRSFPGVGAGEALPGGRRAAGPSRSACRWHPRVRLMMPRPAAAPCGAVSLFPGSVGRSPGAARGRFYRGEPQRHISVFASPCLGRPRCPRGGRALRGLAWFAVELSMCGCCGTARLVPGFPSGRFGASLAGSASGAAPWGGGLVVRRPLPTCLGRRARCTQHTHARRGVQGLIALWF